MRSTLKQGKPTGILPQHWIVVVWLCLTAQITYAGVTFRLVALSGQKANGAGRGSTFRLFNAPPVINGSGVVAFRGFYRASDSTDDIQGIWSEGSGVLRLVAREGVQAVGMEPDVLYRPDNAFFDHLAINNNGDVSFTSMVSGPGVFFNNARGYWGQRDGTLRLLFRRWSDAPDLEPVTRIRDLKRLAYSHTGELGIAGVFIGAANEGAHYNGIWMDIDGELRLAVREGDLVPETRHPGEYFDDFGNSVPYFNQNHQVVFVADGIYDRGGHLGLSFPTHGIWAGGPGSIRTIAREGDTAPGLGGSHFSTFRTYQMSDSGRVMFSANTGVSTRMGIWVETADGLRAVAYEEPLSGIGENELYPVTSRLYNRYYLNNDDQIALHASVGGPGVTSSNRDGIWLGGVGDLELVVRTSDPALGAGQGVYFNAIDNLHALNNVGQVLFSASLVGDGVDESNNFGLWLIDSRGKPEMVLRIGQLFNVSSASSIPDLRVIKGFAPSTMNDSGQLALKIVFTDDTEGIFVVTVPEAGASVVFLGLLGAYSVRRRR